MAPSEKKKKTTNTKKRKSSSARNSNVKENGAIQDDIILIIVLAISILLFLSNIHLCGKVGEVISDIAFGLVGTLAYLLPLILFFLAAFYLSNLGNKKAIKKMISAIVFFLALAALIHIITYPDVKVNPLDFYTNCAENRNGGGFFGGIAAMSICRLFDRVATFIILIAAMLISVIVISGKAFLTYLAAQSKNSLEERREYQKIRREEQEKAASEMKNGNSDRRPAKTFVIKETAPSSLKDTQEVKKEQEKKEKGAEHRKSRAEKQNDKRKDKAREEELPVLNFHNLFDETPAAVPTYEEELRLKFGNSTIQETLNPSFQDNITGETFETVQADSVTESGGAKEDYEAILNKEGIQEENVRKEAEDSQEVDAAKEINAADEQITTFAGYTTSVASNHGTDVFEPETASAENRDYSEMQPPNKMTKSAKTAVKAQEGSSTGVEELGISQVTKQKAYIFPPINLLAAPKPKIAKGNSPENDLKNTAMKLQSTLDSFGVHVTITNVSVGPAVTRYELQPEQGVKVSRITSLADDIKLNLAAADIRIEAPIPGKAAVGIEVPNKENSMVAFREMIESREFSNHSSSLAFAVGKDIGGQTIITDIAKMPHLLIAGATGSGKSVCINTLIMSILYKSKPSDVRMIMVDPKVVELNVYNGIPHLLIPVVTDPKKASAALNWAVMEMTDRYKKFADVGARDLKGYNEKVASVEHLGDEGIQKLPQIIIIIDELADLMMVAPGEVEDAICRLAQLARAAGIHLVIATQRPSVNVITGLIKANIPSRIAFAVSSAIDSRTVIDGSGAEKLLGKGDMLFFPSGYPKPVRIQGAFISDKEVSSVVDFLKEHNNEAVYSDDIHEKINNAKQGEASSPGGQGDSRDDYFAEAGKFIIEKDKASIGMLQRVYKIGFNRAARIMDQLAEAGVVGPEEGTKPRKILMSEEEFEQYLEEY